MYTLCTDLTASTAQLKTKPGWRSWPIAWEGREGKEREREEEGREKEGGDREEGGE